MRTLNGTALQKVRGEKGASMAIYLDIFYTDGETTELERQECTVRLIGEILPYVMAKFAVPRVDHRPNAPRESANGSDFSI
jgi:hypothetical protein